MASFNKTAFHNQKQRLAEVEEMPFSGGHQKTQGALASMKDLCWYSYGGMILHLNTP